MSRHDQSHGQQHSQTQSIHHSQRNTSDINTQQRSSHQTPTQTVNSSPPVSVRLASALFGTTVLPGLALNGGAGWYLSDNDEAYAR